MNTVFLLMAEYETSQIPLEIVAEKFLGIGPAKAKEAAREQSITTRQKVIYERRII